jgi:hypothetical protein
MTPMIMMQPIAHAFWAAHPSDSLLILGGAASPREAPWA